MVIAAAGALSVATAASATTVTLSQKAQGHAGGPAEVTHEAIRYQSIQGTMRGTGPRGTGPRDTAARAAVMPEAMTQEAVPQEAVLRETVVAPRLAATGQLAGPMAQIATEQGGAAWVQRAYLLRLTAIQDAIAPRKAAAAQAAARAARSSAHSRPATTSTLAASGSPQQIAQAMLGSFGWPSSQFSCLDPLWAHESGWSVSAYNAGSGAFGIPQALPGSKMASAGADWQSNPATQVKWGLDYIKGTYGSPCGAWSHEEATGWY